MYNEIPIETLSPVFQSPPRHNSMDNHGISWIFFYVHYHIVALISQLFGEDKPRFEKNRFNWGYTLEMTQMTGAMTVDITLQLRVLLIMVSQVETKVVLSTDKEKMSIGTYPVQMCSI
jgi:hypothetical protein